MSGAEKPATASRVDSPTLLVQLGDADAVSCEGDACIIPAAPADSAQAVSAQTVSAQTIPGQAPAR